MDRREFLITSGGAAVAAASPAVAEANGAPAPAAPETRRPHPGVLRLSMPWTDAPHGPADAVRRLAQRIATLSDGRLKIEIAAAKTGGGGADTELTHGPAHDFASRHPAFAYFAGLPGSSGLSAQDLAHWIAVGGGQLLWDDLAAAHGWKPLLAGHSGEAPPLWSRAPIASLRDLAGRRIAAPGLALDVARALGAEAAPTLGPDEAVDGLAYGSIFAAETGGLLASLTGGVARHARYASGQGLNRHGTAYTLSVRLDVWDRLTDADRAIFSTAAAEAYHASLGEARAHAQLARRTLETSLGASFAPWPTDVAHAIDRVAEATVAHVAAHDDVAARIDHSYMAFRAALSGAQPTRRKRPVA